MDHSAIESLRVAATHLYQTLPPDLVLSLLEPNLLASPLSTHQCIRVLVAATDRGIDCSQLLVETCPSGSLVPRGTGGGGFNSSLGQKRRAKTKTAKSLTKGRDKQGKTNRVHCQKLYSADDEFVRALLEVQLQVVQHLPVLRDAIEAIMERSAL